MSGSGAVKPNSDHPGLVCLVLGPDGGLEWSNTAALRLGASAQQRPKTLGELVHPDDRPLINLMLDDVRKKGRAEGNVRIQDALTRSLRYFQLILTYPGDATVIQDPPEGDSDGYPELTAALTAEPQIIAQAWDVTTLVRHQQELEADAFRDPLTGVANRRTFMTRLDHELDGSRRGCPPVAVLFADVDNFKQVNDDYGHRVGDLVLIELAARLASSLRPDDTVARIGGDEFAILCLNLSGWPAACAVIDRLRTVAGAPITTSRATVNVTLSIGVAFAEETQTQRDPAAHLVALADARMFRAKFADRPPQDLAPDPDNRHVT